MKVRRIKMDTNLNDVIEINIKDLFFYCLRRSWLIFLIGIICASGARYYSLHYLTPIYTSSAKLYITSQSEGQLTTTTDIQIGTYLAQDYKVLVRSRPVAEEVIKRLGLNISSGQLIKLISVNSSNESRIFQITVSYFDKNMVKTLVDTVAQVTSERMEKIMGEKVNVLEDGYQPYEPSGPNIQRNTIIAGCYGMLITAILIVILFMINDTIKTTEDIEKYLGLTTLGLIPFEISAKKNKIYKVKKKKAA
jgi:capsular polysaccharide biosynthesis protein